MKEIRQDLGYGVCMLRAFSPHVCGGRITLEHALIYGGQQVDKKFAIISICARGHGVDEYQDAGTLDKELCRWVALNRASSEELNELSKVINYHRVKDRLNRIYGKYVPVEPVSTLVIQYV